MSQSLQGAGGIGGLLARIDVGAGKTHHYFYDANGNVGQLVAVDDGGVAAAYEYDPYGKIIASKGEFVENNSFKFSTKYYDREYELYNYGYRYYLSDLGRWVNRDPLEEEGGVNLYVFVENNVINNVDFSGLFGDSFKREFYREYPTAQRYDQRVHDQSEQGQGAAFAAKFERFLDPLEGVFERGSGEIKDVFRDYARKATQKGSFTYDLRKPGFSIGIFKSRYGGVVKVSSDLCTVTVQGGPTFAVTAKGPSLITLAGGVTVTGGVKYKYYIQEKQEEWTGTIGGTGWIGLRVGIDIWVAGAFGEGGVYANYKHDFENDKSSFGVGGYVRAVFESGLVWKSRRQYKYTVGDPDVHF